MSSYSGYFSFADEPPAHPTDDSTVIPKDVTLYINGDMMHKISNTQMDETLSYVTKLYDEVLSKINGRKILSTDIYPLLQTSDGYAIGTQWLYDMSCYAELRRSTRSATSSKTIS